MAEDEGPEEHEKTEDPTQKKLNDARERGDVAKSQEVNMWFGLLAITLFFALLAKDLAHELANYLQTFLANAHDLSIDRGGLAVIYQAVSLKLLALLALPFVMLMIAGVAGNLIQHGFISSTEQMTPRLSKISPWAGLKRLFSMISLINFGKSLIKLVLVSVVIMFMVWPQKDTLDVLVSLDPTAMLGVTLDLTIRILIAVLAFYTLLAVLDYAYQYQSWWKRQKMTLKELRDEFKQMEGDPKIKGKIRQIRAERGRKRMMAKVPEASVVITNPTHYSIALKYEKDMSAPICLAKGLDSLALKIREVAKENDIPIVENPPLARSLYATVEIDEEIPEQHYKAVAEVIGYVMRLRNQKKK